MKIRHIRVENETAKIYGGDARVMRHLMSTFVEGITNSGEYSAVFVSSVLDACAEELESQSDFRRATVIRRQIEELQKTVESLLPA